MDIKRKRRGIITQKEGIFIGAGNRTVLLISTVFLIFSPEAICLSEVLLVLQTVVWETRLLRPSPKVILPCSFF